MSQFALKSYVYADQSTGVATLLDEATLSGQAAGRAGYAALAMGANFDLSDRMRAQLEDTNRLQAQLEAKERRQQQLTDAVTKKQAQVDKATAAAQAALDQVKGDLVELVAAGRAGQGRSGGRRPAGGHHSASRRRQHRPPRGPRPPVAGPRRGEGSGRGPAGVQRSGARGGCGRRGGRGDGARSATAMSAYKASPSEGFDCSGLTMWAWAQAGVGLPHQSRQQFASLPHVPIDQLSRVTSCSWAAPSTTSASTSAAA